MVAATKAAPDSGQAVAPITLQAPAQGESFAVGVETAMTPLMLSLLLQPPTLLCASALLALIAAFARCDTHPACRPRRFAFAAPSDPFSLPPPAQAPPLYS